MSNPIDQAQASILKREPTVAAWLAAAAAGAAGSFLFVHFGVDADTVKQILAPAIVGVVLTGFGFLNRSVVVPAATFAHKVEAEVEKRLSSAPKLTEPAAIDPGAVDTR